MLVAFIFTQDYEILYCLDKSLLVINFVIFLINFDSLLIVFKLQLLLTLMPTLNLKFCFNFHNCEKAKSNGRMDVHNSNSRNWSKWYQLYWFLASYYCRNLLYVYICVIKAIAVKRTNFVALFVLNRFSSINLLPVCHWIAFTYVVFFNVCVYLLIRFLCYRNM